MMIGTKNFHGYKGNSTAKWAKFPGEWLSHLSLVRDACIDIVCDMYELCIYEKHEGKHE